VKLEKNISHSTSASRGQKNSEGKQTGKWGRKDTEEETVHVEDDVRDDRPCLRRRRGHRVAGVGGWHWRAEEIYWCGDLV
jgi:hypothetical protein